MSIYIIQEKIKNKQRLSKEDALFLYENVSLEWLQKNAQEVKNNLHGKQVFYNRNIHFEPTNKCIYACKFCSFYRKPKATQKEGAWDYSLEDLKVILEGYPKGSLTEVHITGGVHPDRGVEYGEELIGVVKNYDSDIHVKAFTAVEIDFFAKRSGVSLKESLLRLQKSGLDSLPGGGAEIFNVEIRKKIAGGKSPAHKWLEVHKTAHQLNMKTNATMLYGHIEDYSHRVEHMQILRDLQDQTKGFNSFIPLRYLNENNALSNLVEVSLAEDLKNYAIARLFLDNILHLKSYWVMLGIENSLEALRYGVDDLDGTIDDSTKIYSMAGSMKNPTLSSKKLEEMIVQQGLFPVERNSLYQTIKK